MRVAVCEKYSECKKEPVYCNLGKIKCYLGGVNGKTSWCHGVGVETIKHSAYGGVLSSFSRCLETLMKPSHSLLIYYFKIECTK